ncbi:hypothetical protein HYN48_07205 [Flavobacterium magnum]|uniref:Secretion system C-terminal sorting domain-containing protein n=1 Tax=Flavobacterium magnum TaxID=2162713 RepID=A0A2S0RF15_9FLAO|nr:T9SS type A sorting domain-containing protein [Flavobacterium magnum]AWA29880.1 hypothetical protein HYN48_07205 [Flavobacterium magnum]
MKKILLLAALFFIPGAVVAQTLNPGDIVVIGYAADTGTATVAYNEFSWVPLVNLPAGTKIYFTDAGYNTVDSDFMGSGLSDEILLRYIVPAGGISAGTVMTVTEEMLPSGYTAISSSKFGNDFNGMITLPNAGDQITVFQSTDDETTPATFGNTDFSAIFMLTGSSLSFTALAVGKSGISPVSNVDNLTNLAPGLENGVNAVAVGSGPLEADESDNARYQGIASGTREEILASVCNLANWGRYDSAFGNDLAFGTTPNGWTSNGVVAFDVQSLGRYEADQQSFALYPNPVTNDFRIRTGSNAHVDGVFIYDVKGLQVAEFKNPEDIIDVSGLPPGTYFVKLTSGTDTITRKILKE